MNDDELDLLVASAAPISDDRVAKLPLSGPEDDLLEAIMGNPRTRRTPRSPEPGIHRLRPRRGLAAVAAVLALLVGLAGLQQLQGGGGTAWAAEALAVAEAAPRLLVDRPGWTVARADEFGVDEGEMIFTDGRLELDLHWRPAGEHDGRVADRAASADLRAAAEVAGHPAQVFRYAGTSDYVALWVQGGHSAEARGVFPSIEEYTGLLASLARVDVDTWLRALPESVVKPGARGAAVDEMLVGIPLPEGFDRAPLQAGAGAQDRYQLGAAVAGAVACGWIERWIAAEEAGDEPGAERAVDAMATARRWPILVEMQEEGAYPEVLWELADAMATGATVSGGRPMRVQESYVSSLGCAPRVG